MAITRKEQRIIWTVVVLFALSGPAHAQMVTGAGMSGYAQTLGLTSTSPRVTAHLVASSVPGNVLWPGEQPTFTVQLVNAGDQPMDVSGRVDVVAYGTHGQPGDVWTPVMVKLADCGSVPVAARLSGHGFSDLTVAPRIPARFGGYALVVDLGPLGRQFLTTCARTFAASPGRIQYPHFCLDDLPLPVLKRLGVHAIRYGEGYKPTTDPDFAQYYADEAKKMKAYADNGITVLFMIGAGAGDGPTQPLHRPRPWLAEDGTLLDTKDDRAWLPSYDDDFTEFCRRFAHDYGWPRGPITAFSLWNEPWEGISISGWGADMLRYRQMYTHMYDGVAQARRAGADVLVGGCDSSSNAWDKLFPDGKDTFLPMFDFLSVHYQGLASTANYRPWLRRAGDRGRVKIWDTESWVANTDDRVAAVIAGDRAAGYDRAMGVYGGDICEERQDVRQMPDGTTQAVTAVDAWSTAAAVGAATHFIGERPFRRLLFSDGLPWVMTFGGERDNPEDGTLVVVGDLGEAFGDGSLPPSVRGARGVAEVRHKEALRAQLAALPPGASAQTRAAVQTQIDTPETLSGAAMTLSDPANRCRVYDSYGNPIPAKHAQLAIPLDGRGFFLRGDGKPGAFAALVKAVQEARIDGITPVSIVARDMTARIAARPVVCLEVTNVLNRPVTGRLTVSLENVRAAFPGAVRLGPSQTLIVPGHVLGGAERADNAYPMTVVFDAGRDGRTVHRETMHVNLIARRTIRVDGDLSDWNGVPPQTIVATGAGEPTLTEKAWLPFQPYSTTVKSGLASAYLACDAKFFYFAAKIADATPDPGMVRFATRDDDAYFYPPVAYAKPSSSGALFSARWTGKITPQFSETYTFSTVSDDGVRLTIDGKLLIDNWTDHGPTENTGTIALEAGKFYALTMEYYQSGGGAAAQLSWRSRSQPKQIVPSDALVAEDGETGGLTGRYYLGTDLTALKITRFDPEIDFTWNEGQFPDPVFLNAPGVPLTWPAGVRRYSYRKTPDLPAGNAPDHDNVQIAFNVLPPPRKAYAPTVPGTMPGFVSYQDTDYEYALNPVAAQYGGGTEIWRLAYPGMPRKHFYPRQPRSRYDGAVAGGRLVIRRDGATRIVECAIPWRELPDVKRLLDAGKTIKFSYRVNDDMGGPTMELSKGRSVAKRNASFHEDWVEHWANELEFGLDRSPSR